MGLLDDLKQQAETLKNQEAAKTQNLKANAKVVDAAMRKTFTYLYDLFKQLNVLKPVCPIAYELLSVGKIDNLVQQEYRVEYRTTVRDNAELYDLLTITFKRVSGKVITAKREAELIERFRELLWQSNLRFTSEVMRNDRRVVVSETFNINADVLCGIDVSADFNAGIVRFKCRNVEEFGPATYNLEPASVSDTALEELAKLLIGQPSNFKNFNRRPAGVNPAITGQFLKTQPMPAYVIHDETDEPEVEQKSSLLGTFKSVFRKI